MVRCCKYQDIRRRQTRWTRVQTCGLYKQAPVLQFELALALAQGRRHCLRLPRRLPREIARQPVSKATIWSLELRPTLFHSILRHLNPRVVPAEITTPAEQPSPTPPPLPLPAHSKESLGLLPPHCPTASITAFFNTPQPAHMPLTKPGSSSGRNSPAHSGKGSHSGFHPFGGRVSKHFGDMVRLK